MENNTVNENEIIEENIEIPKEEIEEPIEITEPKELNMIYIKCNEDFIVEYEHHKPQLLVNAGISLEQLKKDGYFVEEIPQKPQNKEGFKQELYLVKTELSFYLEWRYVEYPLVEQINTLKTENEELKKENIQLNTRLKLNEKALNDLVFNGFSM